MRNLDCIGLMVQFNTIEFENECENRPELVKFANKIGVVVGIDQDYDLRECGKDVGHVYYDIQFSNGVALEIWGEALILKD